MHLYFQMSQEFKKVEHAATALELYRAFSPVVQALPEGGYVFRIPGGRRPDSVRKQLLLQSLDGAKWALWGVDDAGGEVCIRGEA